MRTSLSKTLPVACAEWAVQLAAQHSDDLAPDEKAVLKHHMSSCPNCAAVYAEYRKVDARILSLPAVQPSAQQVSQLDALIADRVADEPAIKPVPSVRKSPPRQSRVAVQRRLVGNRMSALAAVMIVALLAASAFALFSSRYSSTLGGVPGTLYTISYKDGTAYALNTTTGKIEWRTPLHITPDEGVLISHGMIFITSKDGFLYAVRENDGKLLWHRSYKAISSSGGRPVIEPSLVSDGEAVYIGAETGLYAWSVSDGHTLWRHAPPAGCDSAGITGTCTRYPVAASNGIVYVYFDGLYALRATDGATIWHDLRFQTSGLDGGLVVAKNRLYVTSSSGDAVVILQADNGHQLDTISVVRSYGIMMLVAGNMIYINSGMQEIYAVRSDNDRVLWHRHYAVGGWLAAAGDGNLYYTSLQSSSNSKSFQRITPQEVRSGSLHAPESISRVVAISAADGSFRWSWQYPAGTFQAGMTGGSGMVYVVGGTSGGIYALHADNGKFAWHALQNTWLARLVVE